MKSPMKLAAILLVCMTAFAMLAALPTGSERAFAAEAEKNTVLVVYFSATGNTKRIAEYIASELGADIFEITPAVPYSAKDLDYTDDNSRTSREYADERLRKIELSVATPDKWESYDTVFIGYPIWWGIAAWPVSTFVEANDFSGKRVIPFCTSASSRLGESAKNLASLDEKGNWEAGRRFSRGSDETDIKNWLRELGL